MKVRRVEAGDREWVAEVVRTHFASTRMVSRGRLYEDVSVLDGFIVEGDGRPIGLSLWEERDGDAECSIPGLDDLLGCSSEPTLDVFRCAHVADRNDEVDYEFEVAPGRYVVNLFFTAVASGGEPSNSHDMIVCA